MWQMVWGEVFKKLYQAKSKVVSGSFIFNERLQRPEGRTKHYTMLMYLSDKMIKKKIK